MMIGAAKPKFQYGASKVKKIYMGTTQVYSSGNVCNYYVNGSLVFTQEYEEGQSVLSPAYTVPSVSGRVFKGWSTTDGGQPVGSLIMGSSPISLYAKFNYIVTYNFNGKNYYQEYSVGENVLSPTVVYPAITGATFLGWVNDPSSTTPLGSLTMPNYAFTLYALFKWADASYTSKGITYLVWTASVTAGNRDAYITIEGCENIPVNRYHSFLWQMYNGSCAVVTKKYGANWRQTDGYVGFPEIGSWAHVGSALQPHYGSVEDDVTLVINNLSFTGTFNTSVTSANFSVRAVITGGNDFCEGHCSVRGYLTLYGKTTTI